MYFTLKFHVQCCAPNVRYMRVQNESVEGQKKIQVSVKQTIL